MFPANDTTQFPGALSADHENAQGECRTDLERNLSVHSERGFAQAGQYSRGSVNYSQFDAREGTRMQFVSRCCQWVYCVGSKVTSLGCTAGRSFVRRSRSLAGDPYGVGRLIVENSL